MFYKLKEMRLSKRETYMDAVEKYIKENGPEALEKLIAMELNSLKCIDSERDINVLELQGNNAAMTSKQLNEPDDARVRVLDGLAKQLNEPDAAARVRVFDSFTVQVQNAESISSASALNETDAVTNVKEITPPEASAETPPLKRTHQEWTCDLCKVTGTTEILLNAHLQGRKHKSKLESLKGSLLDANDTGPSPLVQQHRQSVSAAWDMKGTYAAAEAKEIIPPKETAEKRCPEILQLNKTQIKHKSKLETLKASTLGAKDTGPSDSAISKLNHGNIAEELIKETGPELEKLIASEEQIMPISEVEEMTPLEANTEKRCPETLPLNRTQQECTCGLCKVTTTSEITLNDHLQGSKHKSKLDFLKASMLDAKDTGPSPLEQMPIEVEEMTPLEANMENRCPETLPLNKTQQECACGSCKVTTTSEITLNDHLQGSKHKPKLESLKASMLDAKDSGPSPLIEVMTLPVASNEERRTKTPPLKKEWRCDVCKVIATGEKTLNAHLNGSKHKAKLTLQIFEEQWCDLCNLKLLSDADVASHYKGKRHKSNVGKMEKLEALLSV